MYALLHWVILAGLSLALPVSIIFVLVRGRKHALNPLRVPIVGGIIAGIALNVIHSRVFGGTMIPFQLLFAAYWACAVLLVLRAFDMALLAVAIRVARVPRVRPRPEAFWPGLRRSLSMSVRLLILLATIVPVVFVSALVYRPALTPSINLTDLPFAVERVQVESDDGLSLAAWWMPARTGSVQTAIVCGSSGSGELILLPLYRELVENGYNVLAIDLRAQGESEGRLTRFGAAEWQDLVGAVKWLHQTHGDASRRIVGVGSGIGAVAMLRAAVNEPAIEAVVLNCAFDDFRTFADALASQKFLPPMNRVMSVVGSKVASALTGYDLDRLSPVGEIDRLGPRPVLFIHDLNEPLVPASAGRELYGAASQPKYFYWLPADPRSTARDPLVTAKVIRAYFDVARPVL